MAEPSTATEMVRVPILGENGRISDDYIPESIPQAVTAAEQAAESAASSANQALQQAAAAEKSASSATGSVEQAKSYANNASTYMTTAESHAESAASDAQAASISASEAAASAAAAEVSNKSAADSSADAMGFRNNAVQYRDQAREAAQEAEGYVETVKQLEQNATNSATAAQNSATSASASAETATTAASQASASATNAAASAQTASEKAASVLDHYIESATATTLEPGQQATATVVDNVLQLGIPKGDKGDPGDVSAVQAAEGSDLSVSTDESTVTIDDSVLRARIAELENQAANVVTGTSTDLVAHGEDAYAQKPIEVRVKGKTWVNRWAKPSGPLTVNGVNATVDETGLITLSGTSGAGGTYIDLGNALGVAPGKQYTLASSASFSAGHILLVLRDAESGFLYNVQISSGTTSTTFTSDASMSTMMCRIAIDPGTTVNASFRVMLVDGTEAPDCFTPPASIASVETGKLVTSGKNLATETSAELVASGTRNKIISGPLVPGTYTFSANVTNPVALTLSDGTVSKIYFQGSITDNATFTVPAAGNGLMLNVYVRQGTQDSSVTDIQLELGSTATTYEPPSVTQTPLPEVELRSLPNGTCDELVIRADVTCEVERRIATVTVSQESDVVQFLSVGRVKVAKGTAKPNQYDGGPICDKIPSGRVTVDFHGDVFVSNGWTSEEEAKAGMKKLYPLTVCYVAKDETTEPQSSVTLPALPAPTFNQYHDADIPSDTSTQYARDINIVLSNLEAVQTALLGGE